MTNVLLDVLLNGTDAAASPDAAGAKPTTADGDLFRATLSGKVGAPVTPAPPATVAAAPALAPLQAKIATMLAAGASQSDVIAALASQLATSVAHALGTPTAEVRQALQRVFTKALAPPETQARTGESSAGRARALAQRYLEVAATATTVVATATTSNGQQKRIAGNVLDAQRAKELPAQSILSSAAAVEPALPLPIVPAPLAGPLTATPAAVSVTHEQSAAQPTVASAPAETSTSAQGAGALADPAAASAFAPRGIAAPNSSAAGDGRRVNIGSTPAVSTGGDTLLGRILTRAMLVAATPAATATAPPAATATPAAPASAGTSGAASPTQLAAFIASFESALHAAAPAVDVVPGTGAEQALSTPAPVTDPSVSAAAAVGPVAPLRIEVTAPVTPAPAAAAPAAPIDHSAIADQLLRGAFLRNVGESSEMRLSLVPETLGDISVKLVVNAGNVTAHVVAQTAEARDALVSAQPQLTKSLAEAGLKLTGFSVDLSGSGFAGFAQQQRDRPQNRDRSYDGAVIGDSVDDDGLEAIPSFGPSIAAIPGSRDLNYLA